MKLKLITLLFLASIFTIQTKAQENANSILEKAYKKAKTENKSVFVKYSASWCGWCKKMDKQMKDENCKTFFDDNYVTVNLVVQESDKNKHLETPGAMEVLTKHKGEKSGLPFWAILDSSGKLIEDSFDSKGQNLGCPATEEEVSEFIKILKSTSRISDKNLNTIYEIFLAK
ncbi:thioredoxin family protein [Polaribacter sp. Asnod1-A03]|uniref:thioredoxin family protein n=1 Tax=Polaribacter sp. Asnod1-A03 TaxID=3160581 RepID=UPI00386396E3